MLVPPLKTPLEYDLKGALSSWLDETNNTCGFMSGQVQAELDRLADLRNTLVEAGNDYKKAELFLGEYEEYHAALLECQDKGFPSTEASGAGYLQFPWLSAISPQQKETQSHLNGERANLLWNVASLFAFQASKQDIADKAGWNQSQILLQAAASTLHHLSELVDETISADFITLPFWETFLLAQAQISTYYMARAASKPRHVVLAKLASAAVPLLDDAYEKIPQQEDWQTHCQAWSTCMSALSEYHESCTHRQKKKWDMELCRLERARDIISVCQEFVYGDSLEGLELLQGELPKMVRTIRDRQLEARRAYVNDASASPPDIREIRGELLVRSNYPLLNDLTTLKTPLFSTIQKVDLHSGAKQAILTFQREMNDMIHELARVADEKTEEARLALAHVNLPHSLTAFKQEQMGGGIPQELWERVEALQRQGRISELKREMWELHDAAEVALSIQRKVSRQLEEDREMDQLFRQQNPGFEGHDASEVQRSFHVALKNYESLLAKSQDGDAVLMQRLENLDTDPKYKLLQFQKSKLDRLFPAANDRDGAFDTSRLARLLVELSALFDERQSLVKRLQTEAKKYDIASRMAEVDPKSPTAKQEYEAVIRRSQKSFGGIAYDIRINIDRQVELMDSIMGENEEFTSARNANHSAGAGENCITMIEDAIEETEQLGKHLREGKAFYEIVMPKLDHLQREVGDASVRLTVQRCEYEDKSRTETSGQRDGSQSAVSSYTEPSVTVDDEKVANLVAMDFNPDSVVAALKKHNNDIEQALNELLG